MTATPAIPTAGGASKEPPIAMVRKPATSATKLSEAAAERVKVIMAYLQK
jgi:hypothetical protein